MKTSDAAKEIVALLEEGASRGVRRPSTELQNFLTEMASSPGLKKSRKKSATKTSRTSSGAAPRVGTRRKKPPEVDMAGTIEELARKLREAFENQASFETVLSAPETQALSKANVVTLYNRVFEPEEPLSKSLSKPEIFSAMKRERINRVRGRR
jgi:hypothetical protein